MKAITVVVVSLFFLAKFILQIQGVFYTKIHRTSYGFNSSKSTCVILEEESFKKSHSLVFENNGDNTSSKYFKEIVQPAVHSMEQEQDSFPHGKSLVFEIFAEDKSAIKDRLDRICNLIENKNSIPVSRIHAVDVRIYPEVVKIINTGDPANRIDVVFMGDGYTLEEREKFFQDMKRLSKETFESDTFNSIRPLLNVWAIFIPSKESGIGYNGTPKNTPFKLYRNKGPLRGIFTKNARYARQICKLTGNSACDYPSLIANDDYYGGLGGEFAISTRSIRSGLVVLRHEFGHNFAKVGEEYDTGEVYSGANSANTLRTLKWSHWLSNSSRTVRKEERMIYRILSYPQNDLETRPLTFKFWSDGSYSRWYMFFTVSGAEDDDSLEVLLDGKALQWKTAGTDDKSFFEWEGQSGFSRGRHNLTIRSKSLRKIKNSKIPRMIGSVTMYEYGNENEFHMDNEFISAYPTWDFRGRKRYRPTNAGCLMRNMTHTKLCSVCKESMWLQFLQKVSLVDSLDIVREFNPDGSKDVFLKTLQLGQFRTLGQEVPGEKLLITWYKDGKEQLDLSGRLNISVTKGNWISSVTLVTPEIRSPSSKELLTDRIIFTVK